MQNKLWKKVFVSGVIILFIGLAITPSVMGNPMSLIKFYLKEIRDIKFLQNIPPIANYTYELTQVFNTFYEKCPVAKADAKTKAARVLLVWAFAQTLKNALELLGIEEVEVM